MRTQFNSPASLPPLRVLMGGAVGMALAGIGGAEAQTAPVSDTGSNSPAAQPRVSAPDPVALAPIPVDGGAAASPTYQVNIPSLARYTQPLADTPQTINVIPKQLMQDEQITTTRDALRNVPGLSLAAGEAGSQGDNLTLRGFSARNDIFLDGMRDFGSYVRDPFDLESIEVLQGPSSITFGRGSTGGVVNQVSKIPGLRPVTAGSLTFGTDGTRRITTDVNRAIDGLPGAAVRLNLVVHENGTAERDVGQYRRFAVAPSVAFGLGTPTRLVLSYYHQQQYDTPDYGLPWLYGSPASVDRSNFYGYARDDYYRTNVDIGTVKFEHDVNGNVSIRNQFRYGNYARDIRVTEPQVVYSGAGANLFPRTTTPLNLISVNRNSIAAHSDETFLQDQADVTVRARTGPLDHTIVAGFEVGQETSAPFRRTYAGVPFQTTNLVFPNSDVPFLGRAVVSSAAQTKVNGAAVYLIDTIKLGEQWALTGGIRHDIFSTNYEQVVSPAVYLNRRDSLTSYRAALSYKPVPEGTLYVSYGTSFNPSSDSLTLATNTAGLAPEKNENYEVGGKYEAFNRKLTLSAALFQSEKLNARVTDPNNSLFQILGGNQMVRGYQVGALGNITDRWQITTGFAYLNSEVVKTTLASTQGRVLPNTPRFSGSLFTTYALPWRDIQVGGGVNALSSRIASSTPNATTGQIEKAPGYITVQAMVKVPVREGLDVQLNGYNLTNQKYYDLLHPSHVIPGAGRALLASLNVKL